MEESIAHINDLESLNSEMDALFSDIRGKEESYASRIRALEAQLADAKALCDKLSLEHEAGSKAHLDELNSVRAEVSAKAAETEKIKNAMAEFQSRAGALTDALERERLLSRESEAHKKELLNSLNAARLELMAKTSEAEKLKSALQDVGGRMRSLTELLEEERKRGREKDVFIASSKSALKDKEEEVSRVWAMLEDMKRECTQLKSSLKDKESEIQRVAHERQELELELEKSASAAQQSEQGFYHKIDLLKKELKEKEKEGRELARRFAELEKKYDDLADEHVSVRAGNEAALKTEKDKNGKSDKK